MKHCIWCKRTENDNVSFNKKAHSIPQSLGGKQICENVCDACNSFFGEHWRGGPSIETVLKEAFSISRNMILHQNGEVGKNKIIPRPTSIYFDIDLKNWRLKPKAAYRVRPYFQQKLGSLLKKGIFKIFLEETERVNKNAHDSKFDFIREFVRYDFGDYPVFYFEWHFAIFVPKDLETFKDPQIRFEEEWRPKWLMNDYGFFEFEILNHTFAVPTMRGYDLTIDWYRRETVKIKQSFFKEIREIKNFTDMDITFRFLKN